MSEDGRTIGIESADVLRVTRTDELGHVRVGVYLVNRIGRTANCGGHSQAVLLGKAADVEGGWERLTVPVEVDDVGAVRLAARVNLAGGVIEERCNLGLLGGQTWDLPSRLTLIEGDL